MCELFKLSAKYGIKLAMVHYIRSWLRIIQRRKL